MDAVRRRPGPRSRHFLYNYSSQFPIFAPIESSKTMDTKDLFKPDATLFSARQLVEALFVKAGRRVKKMISPPSRMTWTTRGVSDADGPTANVRNYIER